MLLIGPTLPLLQFPLPFLLLFCSYTMPLPHSSKNNSPIFRSSIIPIHDLSNRPNSCFCKLLIIILPVTYFSTRLLSYALFLHSINMSLRFFPLYIFPLSHSVIITLHTTHFASTLSKSLFFVLAHCSLVYSPFLLSNHFLALAQFQSRNLTLSNLLHTILFKKSLFFSPSPLLLHISSPLSSTLPLSN